MANEITYEWSAEYVDQHDDIQHIESSKDKNDVWPPISNVENCKARLSCSRIVGNDINGIIDRGYAYAGDEYFSTGQKIPASIKKQFQAVTD